jgi:DNA gyrase/topoisomerase IV subunit A
VEHRDALEAVEAALADPHRTLDELLAAADEDDARQRIAEAFGLSTEQAQVVLDMQFRLVTAKQRAALADELQRERTPLGRPLQLQAELDASGRRATVIVGGVEVVGRGRTAAKAVEDLAMRIHQEVARRQHRTVVVQVDGVEGLERFEAGLSSIRFHWRDETAGQSA